MKWKTLCLTAALTAVLAAVPAYALDYTVDAPEDYLFGRPTSVETVTEYGADNVDRSKNTALIPPAFGSPTSYLPDTGEPLTPNLTPAPTAAGWSVPSDLLAVCPIPQWIAAAAGTARRTLRFPLTFITATAVWER